MPDDPVETNPGLYSVIFENDRVRSCITSTNQATERLRMNPDSVVCLSSFVRRLEHGGQSVEVELGRRPMARRPTAQWG